MGEFWGASPKCHHDSAPLPGCHWNDILERVTAHEDHISNTLFGMIICRYERLSRNYGGRAMISILRTQHCCRSFRKRETLPGRKLVHCRWSETGSGTPISYLWDLPSGFCLHNWAGSGAVQDQHSEH